MATYATEDNETAGQHCAAIATIYSATDGRSDDDELNDLYWSIQDIGQFSVKAGFRVLDNDGEYVKEGESPESTQYMIKDWGITKIVPDVEVPDEIDIVAPVEEGGSGAGIFIAILICLIALVIGAMVIYKFCCKPSDEKATGGE